MITLKLQSTMSQADDEEVHLKALVAAFFAAVCGPLSYILELGVNA
jgi:hypothetical protein